MPLIRDHVNGNAPLCLLYALFEVIWALRARRSIRAKLFIRPEQLNDDALRFVELPKLRSGRVELEWKRLRLGYGLLYWRLSDAPDQGDRDEAFVGWLRKPALLFLTTLGRSVAAGL